MKKLLLVLIVNCTLYIVNCPAQEIEWQNTIGADSGDILMSVQQTMDGGYILGGSSVSNISGDKTENSWNNTYDYWIIKTDSAGNIQWQNTIGGSNDDQVNSIQQTSDGGYILGGRSLSNISGDKTENCIGGLYYDYWIVKINALGNIQWQNTIGGNGWDILYSIKQTSDGGYILGGVSDSYISGDKTEDSLGGMDFWIVKTDASGNILWQNTIGGTNNDELHSIQQTSDGGYILGGYSNSNISGDKAENSMGSNDYWIVKTDPSGNIQWENTIGGSGLDALRSIQQTPDGGYILGGHSASNISGDKTENCWDTICIPFCMADYWIVKTDATGNIQWQNTIGGNNAELFGSVQQTIDGGYILSGTTSSDISGDKTEYNYGTDDFWIVKTDASGKIQWQNTIGGSTEDFLYPIQQTFDGGYILGGSSDSNISGDKTENCMGDWDYWIVKLTDNYNSISGKLFIDMNSNNVQDTAEPAMKNKQVIEINTGRFAFSKQNGNYSVSVLDSGNFTVAPSPVIYYNALPLTHNAYFSGIQQTDSLNDFAFQTTVVFNDLCVTITPMGNFRAGFDASYMINYENVGTSALNGTVIFFPDDDVTFVSSNVTPVSLTADSVVWNVGTLMPFQTGTILATVHVNNGTPAGTLINSTVRIEPVAGDANTACNYNAYEVFVTAAIDPNAILVDRDTVLTTELSNPPFLEYIIYFQNTGNDTAFNIIILNPVDTFKLNVSSLEFVASSHPIDINYKIWERNFEFRLDNTLLPDSNLNEPASHGFVRYRIKPKSTLAAGDSVTGKAYIYFDFNQPVMTNTAVTEIVLPTNLTPGPSPKERGVALAPNPAVNTLTIKLPQPTTGNGQLTIFDLFGRAVFQSEILNPESKIKIDVSGFSNGIYFIEITSDEKAYRAKFVKK